MPESLHPRPVVPIRVAPLPPGERPTVRGAVDAAATAVLLHAATALRVEAVTAARHGHLPTASTLYNAADFLRGMASSCATDGALATLDRSIAEQLGAWYPSLPSRKVAPHV